MLEVMNKWFLMLFDYKMFQVQAYFQENCPDALDNGVDIKPMTGTMFLKCINHLFQALNISHKGELIIFDKSDISKELMLHMKDLNYPGILNRGWLLAGMMFDV